MTTYLVTMSDGDVYERFAASPEEAMASAKKVAEQLESDAVPIKAEEGYLPIPEDYFW